MKIGRIEIKSAKLGKPDFGIFLNERKANGDKQHKFNFGKLIIQVIIHNTNKINMTKEKCIGLIKDRIKQCDEDNLKWPGSESWYEGKKRGLLDALELIGMVNNEQNK